MPSTELPKSVNDITHVMEEFVSYANREVLIPPKKSISDLITYSIGHTHANSLFFESDIPPCVEHLMSICASKDDERRKNFIIALKEISYKYGSRFTPEEMAKDSYRPAIMVAQFQSNEMKETPNKVVYKAELPKLLTDTYDTRSVLLFCIRIFNPKIEFIGDFANKLEARYMVNEILKSIPYSTPTSITFKTDDHDLLGVDSRNLFLSSINKANSLTVDGAELDRWTTDDFRHFLDQIKANPRLKVLSLANTKLDICCRDNNKFGFILELLTLDQLDVLNLHGNNLSKLPEKLLKRLQDAVDNSPIETICLGHSKREKRHSSMHGSMFHDSARSKAHTTEDMRLTSQLS